MRTLCNFCSLKKTKLPSGCHVHSTSFFFFLVQKQSRCIQRHFLRSVLRMHCFCFPVKLRGFSKIVSLLVEGVCCFSVHLFVAHVASTLLKRLSGKWLNVLTKGCPESQLRIHISSSLQKQQANLATTNSTPE